MSCNDHAFNSSIRLHHSAKVGERSMSHIKIQAYQQARMEHAAQTRRRLIHGHLCLQRPINTFGCNIPHHSSLQPGTMLSPPTFFEDSFHSNDNITDLGSAFHHQMPAFSFRPLTPLTNTVPTSPRAPLKVESTFMPTIPAPGILTDDVDVNEYSPVGDDELAQAEVDYDITSPASLDSHAAVGSYTSRTDAESSFSDSYSVTQREQFGFEAQSYNGLPIYVPSQGYPTHNPLHSLHSMAFKQNHLALWNGQSSSAPARFPAGHLTLLRSPRSEEPVVQAPSIFRRPNQVQPPFSRPLASSCRIPSNDDLSQSYSSTSTGFSHGFSISELDTSDTEADSDSDEEDREDETSAAANSVRSDHSELEGLKKRQDRDAFLLKLRSQGVSYKVIKRRGGFHEAESTLRGRVRMLTKEKSERVRRPVWTSKDVSLLQRAVDTLSERHSATKARNSQKTPWKKVSEYITDNGGTYQFAPATCAKKWFDTTGHR